MVLDRIEACEFIRNWKTFSLVMGLASQVDGLSASIGPISLHLVKDQFSCQLAPNGIYQVNLLWRNIKIKPYVTGNQSQITWSKLIPIKVITFIWRATLDRILTAMALAERGVKIDTYTCSACISELECENHVFDKYPFATTILKKIIS